MNNVTLVGRLTRDPEIRHINEGTAVANMTLAVDKDLSKSKRKEFEENNKPTADFIRIVAFNKLAEISGEYLQKGSLVGIVGRINTGSYENEDGQRVYTTDVIASNLDILEWPDNEQKTKKETKKEVEAEGFMPAEDEDLPF